MSTDNPEIYPERPDKIILYKFYKNDCPPCFSLGRNLLILEDKLPKDIQIVEKNVAVQENKELAKSFGIDKVPYLVFPHNKKMIGGKLTKEEILNFIVSKGENTDEISNRTEI